MDQVEIRGGALSAAISPHGAELQWLRDDAGRDWLWDGDPAFWTGRAPILFPVIGCVGGGVIRVDGRSYPMPKHGFARTRDWTLVEQNATSATFRLAADDATRQSYPFDFRLDLTFAIDGATLEMAAQLFNPADDPLPASFGFHPALRWPLPGGAARAEHRVVFEQPELAPLRRINADGLLRPAAESSPVEGRSLTLTDALFGDDALIFDRLTSRRLVYGPAQGAAVAVEFPDMAELGIWTKPGAGYLCIEPWAGIADPRGFAGELRNKPGIVMVPPRATHAFAMRLTLLDRT